MSEKYVQIPGCQKKWGLSYTKQEKLGQSYTFGRKKGANHIPGSAEKGAIRHAHRYYGIYPRGSAEKGRLFGTHIRTMEVTPWQR